MGRAASIDTGAPARQLAQGEDHEGEGSHMAASVLQAATADRVPFPNMLAHKQVCEGVSEQTYLLTYC